MRREKPPRGLSKNFIFCIHAHQPVGNFEHVFSEAFDKCYRPLFDVLERHPSFPVCCHLSGSLIDWLETNRPEFIKQVRRMSLSGQIEFLGGGYYEPIYGAIPSKDLKGQIQLMRHKVKELFDQTPKGAWLTERVWDPHLPKILKAAGVEYTVLDDFHLVKGGVAHPVAGYFQAKQAKERLDVFSSVRPLRYLIPFRQVEDTLQYIHSLDGGPESVLVFADDCEKFGLWPGTHSVVYGQGWLHRLLTQLENDPLIALSTFADFRQAHRPKQSTRIPHASYSEMMDWAGGSFYNFFQKYPESRYMRDRMLWTSRSLDKTRFNGSDPSLGSQARRSLYKAQCNCSYWHGVFGGLYLHHLRSAVFENLIKADRLIRQANPTLTSLKPRLSRVRMQSGQRICLTQKEVISFFNPGYGAALEEMDYLPMSVNLMCNLQRHKEHYHRLLIPGASPAGQDAAFSIHQFLGVKDKNIDPHLFYDQYRRLSFMDHFFERMLTQEEFAKGLYERAGSFNDQPYRVLKTRVHDNVTVSFGRKGFVVLGGQRHALYLTKSIRPKGAAGLCVDYCVRNLGTMPIRLVTGVEFNFSIGETQASKGLNHQDVRRWIFKDSWRGLEIQMSMSLPMKLIAMPIETVSGSEMGLEKTYQQLAILCQKEFLIGAGKTKRYRLALEIA